MGADRIMMAKDPKEPELSKEDIAKLAEFFWFLYKLDQRNKREGRYDKKPDAKKAHTVFDKDGREITHK
jgi:hypothetical protein